MKMVGRKAFLPAHESFVCMTRLMPGRAVAGVGFFPGL